MTAYPDAQMRRCLSSTPILHDSTSLRRRVPSCERVFNVYQCFCGLRHLNILYVNTEARGYPLNSFHKTHRHLYAIIAGAVSINNSALYLDGSIVFASNSAVDNRGKQGHDTRENDRHQRDRSRGGNIVLSAVDTP